MALSRILYVGQTVSITTQNGNGTTYYFPVSSASCETTQPIESVSAFGHLGSLATAQTNLTTCRASVKTYLGTGVTGAGGATLGLTASAIAAITGDAVSGAMSVVTVSPNGFTMSGIISSLGVDISLGGFGMADLTFQGIGQPNYAAVPAQSQTAEQANMPSTLEPVTTAIVSGSITTGCATSFKFSLDMPTDTLACLGDPVNPIQSNGVNSIIGTKPPYKATITVEGYGVDISAGSSVISNAVLQGTYAVGHLGIKLPNPKINAKSFNNAVGSAGASMNYTIEDTSANFVTL